MKPLSMFRWYVCARFPRRHEARAVANMVRNFCGAEVEHEWTKSGLDDGQLPDPALTALQSIYNVRCAEIVVSLTENPDAAQDGATRGGRHVEFGLALALDKKLVVIGPRENIFHYHPAVIAYPSPKAFFEALCDGSLERELNRTTWRSPFNLINTHSV